MSRRSERRRIRRVLSANVAEYLTNNDDGASMLAHCSAWLATQPGFVDASASQCKAIIVNILAREIAEFRNFVDDAGAEGVCLVDQFGRQLSPVTLWSARMRVRMKGFSRG